MKKRGILVTIEGIDCCGKTTQVRLLAEKLKEKNLQFLITREPGGTIIGEAIRSILLKKTTPSICHEAELLLFSASRAQLIHEKIEPALNEGMIVLCDRFVDSTTVYQGAARHLPSKSIEMINSFTVGSVIPTATFILDLPIDFCLMRLNLRNNKSLDRIESENNKFYELVRSGYLKLAKKNKERMFVIDGNNSEQNIANIIWTKLENSFIKQ